MMPRDGKQRAALCFILQLAIYLNQSEVELREMTCLLDMQNKRAIVFFAEETFSFFLKNKFNR